MSSCTSTYMMLRYCMSSCTSSHIWCYATVCRLALPHRYDATLLYVVLHFLNIWCYATVCRLALPHRYDATLLYVVLHFLNIYDATLLYVVLHFLTYMMLRFFMSSCTSSHTWCYAPVCRLALPHIHDATLLYVVLHFLEIFQIWNGQQIGRVDGDVYRDSVDIGCSSYPFPYFCGLQCGPLGLQKMLLQYCKLNLNQCPRVTDMVQNTGFGETCCRHFLNSLRTLEAEAGRRICETKKLRTKVEVDATNLLVFARTACTWRMFKTLSFLLKIAFRATAVYQACT